MKPLLLVSVERRDCRLCCVQPTALTTVGSLGKVCDSLFWV